MKYCIFDFLVDKVHHSPLFSVNPEINLLSLKNVMPVKLFEIALIKIQ